MDAVDSDYIQEKIARMKEKYSKYTQEYKASKEPINSIDELIPMLPQMPQVQYDTERQLEQLRLIANKFGLYDAADVIRNINER